MRLVKAIYELTQNFPQVEQYGLTQQMRKAAVSIPSNLAEGAARDGKKEYSYFINVARGSLAELDTQLKIAKMLGYTKNISELSELIIRVGSMLTGLYKKWSA